MVSPSSRNKEYCLIEKNTNSIRMSLRMKFEEADPMDRVLGKKYISNFTNHADDYCILRRKPLEVRGIYVELLDHELSFNLSSSVCIFHVCSTDVFDIVFDNRQTYPSVE